MQGVDDFYTDPQILTVDGKGPQTLAYLSLGFVGQFLCSFVSRGLAPLSLSLLSLLLDSRNFKFGCMLRGAATKTVGCKTQIGHGLAAN